MVYITWVFQYDFKSELIKVIKFDNKVNKSKIVHNEIIEITKEKALMVTKWESSFGLF